MNDVTTDTSLVTNLEARVEHDSGPAPLREVTAALASPRPRGRPPKRLVGRADASLPALRGTFRKAYDLSLPGELTVAHFRRIVAPREVPDTATVTVGGDVLTIEWKA